MESTKLEVYLQSKMVLLPSINFMCKKNKLKLVRNKNYNIYQKLIIKFNTDKNFQKRIINIIYLKNKCLSRNDTYLNIYIKKILFDLSNQYLNLYNKKNI